MGKDQVVVCYTLCYILCILTISKYISWLTYGFHCQYIACSIRTRERKSLRWSYIRMLARAIPKQLTCFFIEIIGVFPVILSLKNRQRNYIWGVELKPISRYPKNNNNKKNEFKVHKFLQDRSYIAISNCICSLEQMGT
jgi:hypothetical protein